MKKFILLTVVLLSVVFFQACKKDPNTSLVKIFVRSASNELVSGAKVIIIGDVNSNPATQEYVDTMVTNGSGFAEFVLADYYNGIEKSDPVAYFDVIAKTEGISGTTVGTAYVRTRVYTTAVETVYLPN